MKDFPQLRDDLSITRQRTGGQTGYVIRDPVSDETFEFGEQEHFLLRRLDGRHSLEQLAAGFSDEYGETLSVDSVRTFVDRLRMWGLLVGAEALALLDVDATEDEPADEDEPEAATASPPPRGPDVGASEHAPRWLPDRAGVVREPRRLWTLARPGPRFGAVAMALARWRWMRFLLPLPIALAFVALAFNYPLVGEDWSRFWAPWNLAQHLLFSLVTVNLAARFTTALVHRAAGGHVEALGLTLALGVIPRFEVVLKGWRRMPHPQILWVLATPLLVRLALFSLGVLGWLMARGAGTGMAFFFYVLAAVAAISFVLGVNPLGRGDGYALMSGVLKLRRVRGQALRVFWSRLLPWVQRPDIDPRSERRLLIYALAVSLYLLALFGLVFYVVGNWLEVRFGGTGVVLLLVLIVWVAWQMYGNLRQLRPRAGQQRRFAQRVAEGADHPPRRLSWGKLLVLLLIGSTFVIPYRYETGGPLELMAREQRELMAELPGVVEQVNYRGGEWVPAGALVARLSDYRQQAELAQTESQLQRQRARLQELLTTPRPEEVELARKQLEAARVTEAYWRDKLARQESLRQDGHISVEEYESTKSRLEVAQQETLELQAKLDLVMEGPHPEEIAAARAEVQRLEAQLQLARERLQRMRLITPIAGRLETLKLQDKLGTFLDEGDTFAAVNDDRVLQAFLDIPESELPGIEVGSPARLKLWAFPDRLFEGQVAEIKPVVEERSFGRVVSVVVEVPNGDAVLKPGMSGYGKVAAGMESVALAFTHRLVRFFRVELWSWIP